MIVLVRIMDGVLKKGDTIMMMQQRLKHPVDRIGVFRPAMQPVDELGPGEIGFLTASIKQVRDTRWATRSPMKSVRTEKACRALSPLCPSCSVACFPWTVPSLKTCATRFEKLALNDASFSYEMETSAALGFGFRCGFLGLLHLEVIRDRIEREYDIELITTAPSVIYHVYMKDGTMQELHNPADMPDLTYVDHLEEPRIKATILDAR